MMATPPLPEPHTISRRAQLGYAAFVWVVVGAALLLQQPVHDLLVRIAVYRGEYGAVEVGTKFLLLLLCGVSAVAYATVRSSAHTRISIGFILFGLVAYLTEGDFIDNLVPLCYAGVLIPALIVLLIRARSAAWISVAAGCGILGLAAVGDVLSERMVVIPAGLAKLHAATAPLIRLEEELELIGMGGIAFAACQLFRNPVLTVIRRAQLQTIGAVLSLGILAIGNAFLHLQYVGPKRSLVGLALSVAGWVGLTLCTAGAFPSTRAKLLGQLVPFGVLVALPALHLAVGVERVATGVPWGLPGIFGGLWWVLHRGARSRTS